jgi:hypothetical protein
VARAAFQTGFDELDGSRILHQKVPVRCSQLCRHVSWRCTLASGERRQIAYCKRKSGARPAVATLFDWGKQNVRVHPVVVTARRRPRPIGTTLVMWVFATFF